MLQQLTKKYPISLMKNLIYEDLELINIDPVQMKDKKVLITGASGIIGIYILSFLRKFSEKYNIQITAWIKNKLDCYFEPLFDGVKIKIGDITLFDNFYDLEEYDYILHSSGYGQPTKFLSDKLKTIEINTTATHNLFKKLKIGGKFLFMSTSEIYSGLNDTNIREDCVGNTTPSHPRACYIEGKRLGETICHIYSEIGFDVKIIRLSLGYGPGTKPNDHRVLNSFIEKAITQGKIEMLDDGQSIRTYCYITDVVEMLLNILFNGKKMIYNVGGVSILKISDLAMLIGRILNTEVVIPKKSNSLVGNPNVVNISIERYLEEFGKNSFIPIEIGIMKTINWQKILYEKHGKNN